MDPRLQAIINNIQQATGLSDAEKELLLQSVKEADKAQALSKFKLERLEHDKQTLSVMLEESIEDLQKKSKAVESQNRELEIEAALERVRAVALSMMKPEDMLEVCKTIALQLESLRVKEIRNVQTAIFDEAKKMYFNYEFYSRHDKTLITEVNYSDHPVAQNFADQMLRGPNQVWVHAFKGQEVKDWLNYQKSTNVFIDTYLENANTLNYYWYSLGPVGIGMSAYTPLKEEEIELFKRFRNVFELAYRRYLDIEKAAAQAREAQIQLALERVRARTMAMHISSELAEVAGLLFEQVKQLGIETYASGFNIWDKEHKNLVSWMSNPVGTINPPFEMPIHSYDQHKRIYESWKNHESFIEDDLTGEALIKHYKFLRSFPLLDAAFSRSEAAGIKTPDRQVHNNAHFSNGYLLFITLVPRPDAHDIFKRFAKVFDQTYTRFLDLQKAEAQAKESQIQLALERVRARSMAMHNSTELHEVAEVLFQQLVGFGGKILNAGIALCKPDADEDEFWVSSESGIRPMISIPHTDDPIQKKLYEGWKNKLEFYSESKGGDELRAHYNYLVSVPSLKPFFEEGVGSNRSFPTWQKWHAAYFSHGYVFLMTTDEYDEQKILIRFARIFEQAYTRFLDLQKAEAQAKESQIQLALERVRARTMAMQRSEELSEAVFVLFQQFRELGENPDQATIGIVNEEERVIEYWVTMYGNQMDRVFKFAIDEPHVTNKIYHAWKEHNKSLVIDLSGKELYEFTTYRERMGGAKHNPEEKRRVINVAFFSKGLLNVQSNQSRSDESIRLLERFATVFDQTYTRFIDLQRAEAQARESQIQLALERVRARTMSMQKSVELSETSYVLFQQLKELGEPADQISIGLFEDETAMKLYSTLHGSQWKDAARIEFDKHIVYHRIFSAWKDQKKSFVADLTGKELEALNKFKMETPDYQVVSAEELPRDRWLIYVAYFSNGFLSYATSEPRPDESLFLLQRFAQVFDLTYTRFLDLQKAEAQAREAQIQLALERVRARTMAMQHSNEHTEAAMLMFRQLDELGVNAFACGFVILDKSDMEGEFWMSSEGVFQPPHYIPHTEEPSIRNMYLHWKNGEESYAEDVGGEALKSHYRYLMSLPKSGSNFQGLLDAGITFPEWQRMYAAYFSHGYLLIITKEPYKEEAIFIRFAKVFEQTYTRFLDLQKAESQARESQIQLALERVRARTMAMQKSEELREVVAVIFEQLLQLGFVQEGSCNINIMDASTGNVDWWMTGFGSQKYPHRYHVEYINHPMHITQLAVWKSGEKYTTIEVAGESKIEFDKLMLSQADFEKMSDETKTMIASLDKVIFSMAFMKYGALSWAANPISDEQASILQRFARVFEQTYTRFLDLQKAEANARESQIEAALERVRSRAMAMHKADDLNPAVAVVFEELDKLKLGMLRCGIGIIDGEKRSVAVWTTSVSDEKNTVQISGGESMDIHPLLQGAFNAWLKQSDFSYTLQGEDLLQYYKAVGETNIRLPQSQSEIRTQYYYVTSFDTGGLFAFRETEFSEEGRTVMKRFANVFNLTYKRFLDLQKAEAQAREAKIEAALEKVRSRSLAMHRSDELQEVVHTVFEKLRELNVDFYTVIIVIFKENSKDIIWWMENRVNQQYPRILVRYADNPYLRDLFAAKERGKELFSKCYFGEEKNKFYNHLFQNTDLKHVDDKQKKFLLENEFAAMSVAIAKNTGIHLTSYSKRSFSEEENEILKRFAKVFEQAYIRFMDLQKAEAQAREAQIEAALERVRSRTMGMQRSEELKEVIQLVYDQFIHLNILVEHTGFIIDYKEREDMNIWLADQHEVPFQVTIPYFDCAHWNSFIEAKQKGKDFFTNHLSFEEKNKFYQDLFKLIPGVSEEAVEYYLSCPALAISTVLLENVGLYIENFSGIPYSDEENSTLMRFGKVFQQTYTRFLDLQKAETQARQAKIEAAMEKVRSRAMAMQKPAELVEVAKLLRTEMGLLGVEELETSSIYIHHESTQQTECWYAIQRDGKLVSDHMTIDLQDTWVGREMLAFYRSDQRQTSIVMQGEPRKEWINYCADHSKELVGFYGEVIPDRTYHLYKFSNGYMGAASPGSISTESWDLLQRATSVFSLAYTRFSDLQLAEAQAREAQIETALERVRSRTLAMQKSDELAETASELFKQLIHLGIEPNRLYICIVTDEIGRAEFWITDEDGSKISMAYSTNMNDNPSMKKMYDGWKAQSKTLMIDMQGKELQDYFKHLNTLNVPFKGGLSQKRRLQYIAYFSKGFIGMASPDEQPAETMQLLERFAAVFNLTFTRFNDLKIAEAHALQAEEDLIAIKAAKKRAEDTLTELQATQKQLVQSEKMASLGELTAGIAHEIQNPLNFVNNFSDVSNELLDEMKTELEKGNTKDVAALVDDVKKNLEKILHHGRRADAIVKGMLQHSRTSSSQKELTDINALADEYLRLAYHGLRAKDKSFNAKFITDFDNDIGKVNVVPQEIGRVILNLINNAFYAVSEKQKRSNGSFHPTVSVQTKSIDGKVVITVTDNGNGIPQKNLEKIFQPFFTTKPTGEGTGLGLSLAYDIVTKGHGGELKVKTKEGEGSEFTIQLPLT